MESIDGLRDADLLMQAHLRGRTLGEREYEEFLAAVERIDVIDADGATAVARRRLTAAEVYKQPATVVERALRDYLALIEDPYIRYYAAAAACVGHPNHLPLCELYQVELARVRALPDSPPRTETLAGASEFQQRVWGDSGLPSP
ncbi:hypothetical protein [Haliangium sp.]|uniref:hypothetical protein n=1 Tax=Haliangium sp. TaxID=2663208 RepID=UPI003D110119